MPFISIASRSARRAGDAITGVLPPWDDKSRMADSERCAKS